MLKFPLTDVEARVLGCLMEKSITTPDAYPLSLNALISACNQKSSRDPVMQLHSGEVQRTLRLLEEQLLVSTDTRSSRVERYLQRFGNTPFAVFEFDSAQFAVITLMLLRGPQTPGELRARSGRLHTFADNDAVLATLNSLVTRDDGPMVARLPMTSGRRDYEYTHLFCGPVEQGSTDALVEPRQSSAASHDDATQSTIPGTVRADTATPIETTAADYEARLAALEQRLESTTADYETRLAAQERRLSELEELILSR